MTGGVVDPGDPFEPGSVRFEARTRLLQALETLIGEAADTDGERRLRDLPAFDDLLAAHRRWVLFGRDGE